MVGGAITSMADSLDYVYRSYACVTGNMSKQSKRWPTIVVVQSKHSRKRLGIDEDRHNQGPASVFGHF